MKLKDIGTIVTGNTPSKKNNEYYESNDILFVKPSDIEENYITSIEKSEEYISEKAREKARILPEGAVLVTCIGTIGKVGILKQEATCNQQINAIIPNDKVISKYLAYLIQSRQKILQLKANAPVVPIINKTDFSEIEINICDIEQQKQIVRQLDLLKSIIDKRKVQIDELQNIVKSQFVEMFGDIKSNDKSWKIKKGSELFIFSSGKGNITSNLSDNFEYKCYGGNGITGLSKDYLIDYDTIVIGRVGAYCGSVHKTEGKVWITDNAIYIKKFKEDNNIKFLEELFKVIDFHRFANFSGQPKITQQPLQNYNYILPPIELQNQFADIVKQIDKQKFESEIELRKIQKNIFYKWGR